MRALKDLKFKGRYIVLGSIAALYIASFQNCGKLGDSGAPVTNIVVLGTPIPTPTPSSTPSSTPTPTPKPTATPVPTPTPAPSPTPTKTPGPTPTPVPSPTPTPTPTPKPTATPVPTATPTPKPTPTPSGTPLPPIHSVQKNDSHTTGSLGVIATNFSSKQTAANFNIIVVDWATTTASSAGVANITDTDKNTYTAVGAPYFFPASGTNFENIQVFYAPNIIGDSGSPVNSVTATFFANVTNPEIIVIEYTGLGPSAAPLSWSGNGGNNTQASVGPFASNGTNALFFAPEAATLAGHDIGTVTTFNKVVTTNGNGNIVQDTNYSSTTSQNSPVVNFVGNAIWVMMNIMFQ